MAGSPGDARPEGPRATLADQETLLRRLTEGQRTSVRRAITEARRQEDLVRWAVAHAPPRERDAYAKAAQALRSYAEKEAGGRLP